MKGVVDMVEHVLGKRLGFKFKQRLSMSWSRVWVVEVDRKGSPLDLGI